MQQVSRLINTNSRRKMQPTDEVGFTVSYPSLFAAMLMNMALVMLPLNIVVFGIILWLLTHQIGMVLLLVVVIVVTTPLAAAIAAFIGSFKPRAYLSPQGIRVHDLRGKLFLAEWDSITDVRLRNRLGVKYLIFKAQNHDQEMVLPLFMKNIEAFEDTASHCAGDSNPLVSKLIEIYG
jgi:hypothetical protein